MSAVLAHEIKVDKMHVHAYVCKRATKWRAIRGLWVTGWTTHPASYTRRGSCRTAVRMLSAMHIFFFFSSLRPPTYLLVTATTAPMSCVMINQTCRAVFNERAAA